jgi:hypothetical protein
MSSIISFYIEIDRIMTRGGRMVGCPLEIEISFIYCRMINTVK